MSELKETKKMKVVQLHERTPKQFLNPTPTKKSSQLVPQKVKNGPKIKSKSKVIIKENIEIKSCSTKSVDPKTVFKSHPDSKSSPL